MNTNPVVTVYGAYGHTGRFVVAELRGRGWTPILSGRDADALATVGARYPDLALRPASADDPSALDRALDGAAAVINCAGPFAGTAPPLIEAALRARIPYLDVTGEVEVVADTFRAFDERARDAGLVILPSMAFYGGLSDLLATAAMGEWTAADEIQVAYALSSWQPTPGTRAAGRASAARRNGRRLAFADGRLHLREDGPPILEWVFPAPVGTRTVQGEFTMADTVTLSSHLTTSAISTYMTVAPLADLADPDPSPPPAVDASGRSAQMFLVEVVVRRGEVRRRAVARGRDIYAVTAPLLVEAAERVLAGGVRPGVVAAGAAFPARDFLTALDPERFAIEFQG